MDISASLAPVTWMVDSLSDAPAPAVWVVDLDVLDGLPPPTAKEAADAREYPEDVWARRYLARRAAARMVAARAIGCDAQSLDLDRNARGGLNFVTPQPPWAMSISHRGPYAAIGLGRAHIGVDLEDASEGRQIPWNVLHPHEAAQLRDLPDDARASAFLRLWTIKEAYLKSLGLGFAREPSSFAVTGEAGAPSIDDGVLEGQAPTVASRVLSELGPENLFVSCVSFQAG